ncbi:MAG: Crp/Fnr family transcriptional regulator, partial [Solirubrobacteraceae bacterium]
MPSVSSICLSDADPSLARFLTPEERASAGDIPLPLLVIERGQEVGRALGDGRAFAALVLDGMLLQTLSLSGHHGIRLLGPGDLMSLVEPARSGLLSAGSCRSTVGTRLVLFEREILLAARRWPLLVAGLHARATEEANRLLAQMMICQMPRVDERVLSLLWLLAESWGQLTRAGMKLPVILTHGTIGGLIGARRPTVTLAIGELVDRGALLRQEGGGWLLLERPHVTTPSCPEAAALGEPRVLALTASDWAAGDAPAPLLQADGPETPSLSGPAPGWGLSSAIASWPTGMAA